ncbi:MAG: Hercynine oxygenase [Verrucomicrobiae bacterium]|nr:Hercynine oxygenase [Verrucomicrobiae bacterium]
MKLSCRSFQRIAGLSVIALSSTAIANNASENLVATQPDTKNNRIVDLGGGVTMEFVLIPPGSFMMGSESGDIDEKPVHKVTFRHAFYLGKYEVTQEQWESVIGTNPSNFKGTKKPVERVSWDDCQKFFARLKEKLPKQTFRLPTEAEWEYACRAGAHTLYGFGDDEPSLRQYAWYSESSPPSTHPVGEKKSNAWGLYDMHGNVWEWCVDWYGDYSASDKTNPVGPDSGQNRVLRGGACYNKASALRTANRYCNYQGARYSYFGFRVVLIENP